MIKPNPSQSLKDYVETLEATEAPLDAHSVKFKSTLFRGNPAYIRKKGISKNIEYHLITMERHQIVFLMVGAKGSPASAEKASETLKQVAGTWEWLQHPEGRDILIEKDKIYRKRIDY